MQINQLFFIKIKLICGIFLLASNVLFAQNESYQIALDNQIYRLGNLLVNENSETKLLAFGLATFASSIHVMDITSGEGIKQGITLSLPFSGFMNTKKAAFSQNSIYLLTLTNKISSPSFLGRTLIHSDFSTEESILFKKEYFNFRGDFVLDNQSNLFMMVTTLDDFTNPNNGLRVLEMFYLSDNQTLWKHGLTLSKEGIDTFNIGDIIARFHPDGYFLAIGSFRKINNTDVHESFLLKINQDGTLLDWKSINQHQIEDLYIAESGEIYLVGNTVADNNLTDNDNNAIIISLDENLEANWTKIYHAEAFEYSTATLGVYENGDIALAYSTAGAFPVIYARLSNQGEIIEERGYPLYSPQLDILPDGSLYMLTNRQINDLGELSAKIILSKTDTSGLIDGCDIFPTCLEAFDANTTFGEFEIDTVEITDMDTLHMVTTPNEFNFVDYCETPAPPSPVFNFPDTVCILSCESTTNTRNALAHGIEWQLVGEGVDSILIDSLNFNYCFPTTGIYTLQQTVWFLGCPYSYEKSIEVIENFSVDIAPDNYLCQLPATLSTESSRPINTYQWSTGENTPTIEILQPGTYSVAVQDAYCQTTDMVTLNAIEDLVGNQTVIQLPDDTTICEQFLPFSLIPISPFSDEFSINNAVPTTQFLLNESDTYIIGTMVEGCLFESSFTIDIKECESFIQIPNAFTPNGDGTNDTFFPIGEYFASSSIKIYNRWGKLVFEQKGKDAFWDGQVKETPAAADTYIYIIEYLNLLTMQTEKVSGDVTLIR